jgi:hypothetical protein
MEQQKKLQDVFALADQRKAAAESKRIEESGGKVDFDVILSSIVIMIFDFRIHFQSANHPDEIQLWRKFMIK